MGAQMEMKRAGTLTLDSTESPGCQPRFTFREPLSKPRCSAPRRRYLCCRCAVKAAFNRRAGDSKPHNDIIDTEKCLTSVFLVASNVVPFADFFNPSFNHRELLWTALGWLHFWQADTRLLLPPLANGTIALTVAI